MSKLNILLIGTGYMAGEHARTLQEGLGANVTVAARNPEKLKKFHEEFKTQSWCRLEEMETTELRTYDGAIIASSIDSLEVVTDQLVQAGIKKILVEKPATLDSESSERLYQKAKEANCQARVAYNRRYYSPILSLKKILDEETVVSGFFDFTEWPDRVLSVPMKDEVKSRLAIANSGHVIDTVEFLLGPIESLSASITGKGHLDWHPAGATFVGSALCGSTPVSYCTSWESAGRWNIEVSTTKGKYKLSPMEQLQFLPLKSIHWEIIDLKEDDESKYKPGLLRMLQSFFTGEEGHLPDLHENARLLKNIELIAGYRELI